MSGGTLPRSKVGWRRARFWSAWGLLGGFGLVVVGLTLWVTGGAIAILPPAWASPSLSLVTTATGLLLSLTAAFIGGRGLREVLARDIPHLLVNAPFWLNLLLTLLLLGGTAILFHATTDFIGGALAPGFGVGGETGPILLSDVNLTDAVSVLVMGWILILMAQLLLYGPKLDEVRRGRPPGGMISPAPRVGPSRRSLSTLGGMSVLVGAVALESAEVVTGAPLLNYWYATLPFAILVGALVGWVVSFVDRGLRVVEVDLSLSPSEGAEG